MANLPISPVDAAYLILKRAKLKDIELSNLHLQKIAYLCHGYMLAMTGNPLFTGSVLAWKYGPVIDSIYHQFKEHKDQKIVGLKLDDLCKTELPNDVLDIVDAVLDTYGRDSAMDLVNLTHQPNSPWDTIWNVQKGRKQLFAVIPNDLIKAHFQKAISEPDSVSGL